MPASATKKLVIPSYRERSTSESRAIEFFHTIDPGFVNRRLIQTVIGPTSMACVDELIRRIPNLPEGLYEARSDHVYKDVLLVYCEARKIKTLGELIATGDGELFCSTEHFKPCPNVYTAARVTSVVSAPGNADVAVLIEYSTKHLHADTLRMLLHKGASLSVVAVLHRQEGNTLVFHPLVIGGPWMRHSDEKLDSDAMWIRFAHNENFIEDFDEFAKASEVAIPEDCSPMKAITESAFKTCLGLLLHDSTKLDWGGETSDHFTSHIHLNGRRLTGAFILKGRARFAPMKLNHLGKNNDQIVRLAQEPADVLFVQHCHDIDPAVRSTLRAFAVQPSRPRRYCLIDGKDSLRLLYAYGLYDRAIEQSSTSLKQRRRRNAKRPERPTRGGGMQQSRRRE